MRSFCVYRCFDADGVLLYIGHSARIGVPRWWVEQLISPEPPVVVGAGDGGAAPLPHGNNDGTPTLRTVRGSHPRTA